MSATRHNQRQSPDPRPRPTPVEHELYDEHAVQLRRVVRSRVDTSEANLDDACSFAWMQLIVTPPRLESAFVWLVTVATREAWRLDRFERQHPADGDDLAIEALESPTANADAEDRVHLAEVVEGLKTIHPRKRRMLLLHGAGFTYQEIAQEYGVSIERARELVYRARLQLRDRVDRGNGAPGGEGAKRRRR